MKEIKNTHQLLKTRVAGCSGVGAGGYKGEWVVSSQHIILLPAIAPAAVAAVAAAVTVAVVAVTVEQGEKRTEYRGVIARLGWE